MSFNTHEIKNTQKNGYGLTNTILDNRFGYRYKKVSCTQQGEYSPTRPWRVQKAEVPFFLIGISLLLCHAPLAPLQFNKMKIYTSGDCSNAFQENELTFQLLKPRTQFH